MPKNNKGGKKFKRGKKGVVRDSDNTKNTRFANSEEGEIYCQVKKRVGGSRLEVECSDGKIRSAIIPGKFRKRVWMNIGDVLLATIEDTDTNSTCYIEHKYKSTDIAVLRSKNLINFESGSNVKEETYAFQSELEGPSIPDQPEYEPLPNTNHDNSVDQDAQFNFDDI